MASTDRSINGSDPTAPITVGIFCNTVLWLYNVWNCNASAGYFSTDYRNLYYQSKK